MSYIEGEIEHLELHFVIHRHLRSHFLHAVFVHRFFARSLIRYQH